MSPYLVHRSSHLRTACVAVVAAIGFLAAPPRASADTVKLSFDKTALPLQYSSTVSVKIASGPGQGTYNGVLPGPYYWHEENSVAGSLFPNPTTTFCVELTQNVAPGNDYTFTTSSLASAPGVSSTQATEISQLYAGHYNTAWEGTSFTGSDQSTAFQLALWALVYDSDTNHNLTGSNHGNLNVTSASQTAINTAQNWLDTLSSQPSFASVFPNSQIVWLGNPCYQDQLTVIPTGGGGSPHGVPAPPGVLLGLIGLGGCLFGRGFRRQTSAAVAA